MGNLTATEIALLALGKTQVDVMFSSQENGPGIDDSEFLPMLEAILMAFVAHGLGPSGVDELWDYAFSIYDKTCREAAPEYTFEENRDLMRSYLLGPRKLQKRKRRGHT